MRGINKSILSGNVSGDINFSELPGGDPALSFSLASDRRSGDGGSVTVWVRVNVYIQPLIHICRERLHKGGYVLVEGELMNRDGVHGKLTEVRAREIIFMPSNRGDRDVERSRSGGF
jgi:single-stranded DNA-binding protein